MTEKKWYKETLYADVAQSFSVSEELYSAQSAFQKVEFINNPVFGRTLILDGIIQTTENDEFVYHEMMTHVPIMAHGNVKKVLIIGAGDGGILREVLQHKTIEKAVMVEIDGDVVEMSKKLLPSLSNGAFNDPRAEVIIGDGVKYMKESPELFDVIIVDSSDPVGPNVELFGRDFYQNCHKRLTDSGILVTQNGVVFFQADELIRSHGYFKEIFTDASCYVAAVPAYYGGFMTMGWACKDKAVRQNDAATIKARVAKSGIKTKYYNEDIHLACFALPQFVKNHIA